MSTRRRAVRQILIENAQLALHAEAMRRNRQVVAPLTESASRPAREPSFGSDVTRAPWLVPSSSGLSFCSSLSSLLCASGSW